MKVVAYEAANNFVKSKSDSKDLVYLNTVRERGSLEEDIDGKKRDDEYLIEGVIYTVGDASTNALTSSARGVDRYRSPQYRIESLIAISQHVTKDGEDLRIVTGVPSSHYKADIVNKYIRDALLGRHEVNGRSFKVVEVEVMLQPLGTLTYLVYNEDGSYRESGRELKEESKLVIDIGWWETNLAELEGRRNTQCVGIETAMFNVYSRIEENLREKHKALFAGEFGVFELVKQLRSGEVFKYGNVGYDVSDIKKDSLERTASAVMSKIGAAGFTLSDYDTVIFTGGGVEALATYLKPHLEDIPNAIKVKSPQEANVRGYYIQGVNTKVLS